jgi:hypothetical protein
MFLKADDFLSNPKAESSLVVFLVALLVVFLNFFMANYSLS